MRNNEKGDLNPSIQRIEVESGVFYSQCKATVAVEISDGNGGRKDLIVEYPMQGEIHMATLMKHKDTKTDVNHAIKMPIVEAIDNMIRGK